MFTYRVNCGDYEGTSSTCFVHENDFSKEEFREFLSAAIEKATEHEFQLSISDVSQLDEQKYRERVMFYNSVSMEMALSSEMFGMIMHDYGFELLIFDKTENLFGWAPVISVEHEDCQMSASEWDDDMCDYQKKLTKTIRKNLSHLKIPEREIK